VEGVGWEDVTTCGEKYKIKNIKSAAAANCIAEEE